MARSMGATALIGALALVLLSSSASAQAPQGCDYADSGSGTYADTICWIDFSSFDVALATSPAGQPMSVSLPGGYTASLTVAARPVPGFVDVSSCVRALPVSFWTSPSWPLGGQAYTGIAGSPGLLNTGGLPPGTPGVNPAACRLPNSAADLQLNNITVMDAGGQPVTGFGIVSTESEASIQPEGIRWTSDSPLRLLDTIHPGGGGCVDGQVTGYGTTTVTCVGRVPAAGNIAAEYGTSLILAESPTFFNTASLRPSRILGTAYGFVTSKVRLNKVADQLHAPSDSFDLAVRSGGAVLGSGSTGGALTGSTGEVTVLTGGSFELGETGAAGTDLANYTQSWTCERNGVVDPSLSSSGTTTKTVTPGIGDFIDCTVTNTLKRADLEIVKSASTSPVVPAQEASFELRVTNNGPDEARNVRVSDRLPVEFSFRSASPRCSEAGGTLTCTVASLAPGASQMFTVTGRVARSLDNCLENTATVASDTVDLNSGNNSSTICVPINKRSDLSITKDPSRTTIQAGGGQIMYTLVVGNDGPSNDTGVQVSDPMTAGLTLVAATPSQGSCTTTNNTVVCDLGTLRAGGSAQVLVTATTTSVPGCITNTARVRGANEDRSPDNNQDSAQVCVQPPPPPLPPPTFDLEVDKDSSATRVVIGQRVTYRIVVTNNGPAAAPDVVMTDTLNAPVTVVAVRTTAGSCEREIPVPCRLGTIQAGASVTITIVAKHRKPGCEQRNAASATDAGTDSSPANNMDTVDVCVRKIKGLTITKIANRTTVTAGDTFSYRIRVRNPTKGEARNVRVCDRLPAGLLYVSSKPNAKLGNGSHCWTVKRLGARRHRQYRITVRALPSFSGTTINRATATSADARTRRASRAVRILPRPAACPAATSARAFAHASCTARL